MVKKSLMWLTCILLISHIGCSSRTIRINPDKTTQVTVEIAAQSAGTYFAKTYPDKVKAAQYVCENLQALKDSAVSAATGKAYMLLLDNVDDPLLLANIRKAAELIEIDAGRPESWVQLDPETSRGLVTAFQLGLMIGQEYYAAP